MSEVYAKDAAEQLRRWDAGEIIWSVEMGGLGPGYEQAIQILVMEMVRDNLDKPLPEPNDWSSWGGDTVTRIDFQKPDGKWSCGGFSGAQVGAAKALAYCWLKEGPSSVMNQLEDDRKIMVSNFWPRVQASA